MRGDLDLLPEDLAGQTPRGEVELVADSEHLTRVVRDGMLAARVSLDIATADFKAMLVPVPAGLGGSGGRGRRSAPSIISHLMQLAQRGVEVRLLHAGVPSGPALRELKKELARHPGVPLTIRRCPRLHAKAVVADAGWLYLGSANLTGAGLGAKGPTRRNFEWGVISQTPELVDAVLGRFNALWEGTHCAGCGRRDVCPVPLEEPRL